jgi:hypothetical protein
MIEILIIMQVSTLTTGDWHIHSILSLFGISLTCASITTVRREINGSCWLESLHILLLILYIWWQRANSHENLAVAG